jgi:hypothetical protein
LNHCRNKSRLAGFIILIIIVEYALIGCGTQFEEPKAKNGILIQTKEHKKTRPKLNTLPISSNTNLNQDDYRPLSKMTAAAPVRAIYVTSNVANSQRINELIDLVDQTELNAMVLDINSGITLSSISHSSRMNGQISFTPSTKRSAQHFRQVIKQLKQHHIYLIARIITFNNPALANAVPAWALKRKDGQIWRDRKGHPWIDPYRQEAWEYTLALAEYAEQIGFDEIQYDYVRFPENAVKVDREVAYANDQRWTKSEAIRRFLHRAAIRSHKSGIRVSADVFGIVGSSSTDMGIGQKWDSIVKEVDVISPMIYPSHYSKGVWGIDNPDLSPGTIISHALQDATKQNRKLNRQGIATAKVRPWLQGFTAGWVHPHQKYGAAQIREQIQAARKAGVNSYMLWNSSCRYANFNT